MALKRRLEVIATNGSATIRLFWLEQNSRGIYGSLLSPGIELHRSYHVDGNVHWKTISADKIQGEDRFFKSSGYSKDTIRGHPLSCFRGHFQFFMGGHRLDPDVFDGAIPYKFAKLDHCIFIDTRCLPGRSKHVDLYAYLVQGGGHDDLKEVIMTHEAIAKREGRIGECHIYTDFNPWVVLYLMLL